MWTKEDEDASYAVLSTQFIKNWKRWVSNPLEQQRPERIDNTQFFCHHELLAIDLNCPSDLDSSIMIIRRDEWNVLNSMYVVRVVLPSDFISWISLSLKLRRRTADRVVKEGYRNWWLSAGYACLPGLPDPKVSHLPISWRAGFTPLP